MNELTLADQRALLTKVASLLSTSNIGNRGPWTLEAKDQGHNNFAAAAASGPRIWFRFDEQNSKGKVSVHASYPKGMDGREVFPRMEDRANGINISYKKTPMQIADDIDRRFMPGYLAAWDKQLAEVNAANAYEMTRQANYDRLATETGAKVRRDEYDKTRVFVDWPNNRNYDKGYVHGVMVNGGTMQFEVRSVPMDKAIKILNIIYERADAS